MKVMLDLDGTINYAPCFFRVFTHAMRNCADIHVVSYRMDNQLQDTIDELERLGIIYHHLTLTRDKLRYVLENAIDVVFEDMDEFFRYMPESVTVFKIREADNFDFRSRRWVYDGQTGVDIEDL